MLTISNCLFYTHSAPLFTNNKALPQEVLYNTNLHMLNLFLPHEIMYKSELVLTSMGPEVKLCQEGPAT